MRPLLFFVLISLSLTAYGQIPQYQKCCGAVTGSNFLNGSIINHKMQLWYNPSDFSPTVTSGTITSIFIRIASGGLAFQGNYQIKVKQPLSGIGFASTTFETGMTLVKSGGVGIYSLSAIGWNEIILDTPFPYNPSLPLVVEFSFTNANNTYGQTYCSAATGSNKKLEATSQTATTGTFQNGTWEDFAFYLANATCVNPPVAGTATASRAYSCGIPSSPVTLDLTGNSQGNGMSYIWEESPTGVSGSFTPASTASSSSTFTITPMATTYYRCALTCNGNITNTTYSNPVRVAIFSPLSGTYTINPANPTGGTNFSSFADATTALKCGISGPVTFNVTPGIYQERIWIDTISGSSAANKLIINGNGAEVVFTSTNNNKRGIITLNGADHVTIDSLKIRGFSNSTSQYGWGIYLYGDADSNTITRCDIQVDTVTQNDHYAGVVIGSSTNDITNTSGEYNSGNIVTNNTIAGGGYGIVVNNNLLIISSSQSTNVVSGNDVRDFSKNGIDISDYQTAVFDNSISRPSRVSIDNFIGIKIAGKRINVYDNRIHHPFTLLPNNTNKTAVGIYTECNQLTSDTSRIYNNLIYGVNGKGTATGIVHTGKNTIVAFNTIVFDDTAQASGNSYGCDVGGGTLGNGNAFYDNNIILTRSGNGLKYGLKISSNTLPLSKWQSKNNNYYINGLFGTNFIVNTYTGGNIYYLSDWQTSSNGQDDNSVTIDPQFQPGTFMPGNSALNDLGYPVYGIGTDIAGNTRGVIPDIGAYEFSGCQVPQQPGSITGDTVICQNTNTVYTVAVVPGALSYTWSLPGGWTGVSTTNSINVTTGTTAGTISVKANNACGSSLPQSLNITVFNSSTPGAIVGLDTVCSGASLIYSIPELPGATSYSWTLPTGWSGSSTTDSITVVAGSSGGNIAVAAVNSCGISLTQTQIINVNNAPSPIIDYNYYTGLSTSPIYQNYQWYLDSQIVPGATNQTYVPSQSGQYAIEVTNGICTGMSIGLNVLVDSVWPGDANNDFVVDIFDALSMAVSYGYAGSARSNSGIIWQPAFCYNWVDTFANGTNVKHSDCNGDGTINTLDLLAISANFGNIHTKPGIQQKTTGLPDLYFDLSGLNFLPGNTVAIPIKLGTPSSPVNDIYGIAGNIQLDGVNIQDPMVMSYPGSWLGSGINTLNFEQNIPGNLNYLPWCYSRIDHQNTSGYGTIALLSLQIPSGISETDTFKLSFHDTRIVNKDLESYVAFNEIDTFFTITLLSITDNTSSDNEVYIAPNPSNGRGMLYIHSNKKEELNISIYDMEGRMLQSNRVKIVPGINKMELSGDALSTGLYMIHVDDGASSHIIRWIKN